ncbi:MAG: nucleotide sugar dehydrogenase [Desulfovibrionaceae bacterium]|nr:nucleotide sugar dehydrogenase [Desulfovibrionaceae bacterium]
MVAFEALLNKKSSVAVVGLGYVGLPLVVALARHFDVIGFDINASRVAALQQGHDATNEVNDADLQACTAMLTCDAAALSKASIIIVAVPTPVDSHRNPDLSPVLAASRTVGKVMSKGCVVCYESTVYPGVTEDECVPVLEKESGLRFPQDFTVGYSPERINPGDKVHRLETILKIVSGSDADTAALLGKVYGAVVRAGIHQASCIKVAEAAKVIENTQRDINIALMNELALIFEKMGIDTMEVLEAAGTKWNFLPFRPGLVGGHCIGVDPYYLTYKAEEMGYHPEVILAGRRINDNMGKFVAESCVKQLIKADKHVKGARVGILGFTFKENVPDIRNTRVVDIIAELQEYGITPLVCDPEADALGALHEYGQELLPLEALHGIDALILAVAHDTFRTLDSAAIAAMFDGKPVTLLDIKGFFNKQIMREAGFSLWRL